jgi:hypothetical protein
MDAPDSIDPQLAGRFASVALANVRAEYPFHLQHFARSADDILPPGALHPVFHGSYDWHSCVHMHWTLARCLRWFPDAGFARAARAHFAERFTVAAVAGELAYLQAPGRAAFERPYGWAWLLKLAVELDRLAAAWQPATAWRDALVPLAAEIAARMLHWLPRQQYPIRTGTHGNTAFALTLAHDWARHTQHPALLRAIGERANLWYGRDRRYPAHYEPGGDEFLSGGLCEAVLMLRAVDGCDFADWWEVFTPDSESLARWLAPVSVSDPADAKIVHLHGLNLSRVWCWRRLLPSLPASLHGPVRAAIEAHLAASLAAATDGHYVGTHWLASFALLALTDAG